MVGDVSIDEVKRRGVGVAAPADLRALYTEAFERFGVRALWNSRAVAAPDVADLLAITESLRVEGGIPGRRLAVQIEVACRAAI